MKADPAQPEPFQARPVQFARFQAEPAQSPTFQARPVHVQPFQSPPFHARPGHVQSSDGPGTQDFPDHRLGFHVLAGPVGDSLTATPGRVGRRGANWLRFSGPAVAAA
ncbi:MAG TPA: hypothetical protein VK584_13120, partial [Streptosporangiaceae bacterium]|nr:hypothetical protein [Streptosporangiaceae bacterium]